MVYWSSVCDLYAFIGLLSEEDMGVSEDEALYTTNIQLRVWVSPINMHCWTDCMVLFCSHWLKNKDNIEGALLRK